MEAFDLDTDSLVGFSNNNKQVIIKDETNTIYANISPKTKRRVDDFFNCFN